MNDSLPPNTLILPLSTLVAERAIDDHHEAQRIVRRSCHFLSPGDHLTIHGCRPIRSATPLLTVIEIQFSALTAAGRHVYCSPIDWTSSTPTVDVTYITGPGISSREAAGGQTPLEAEPIDLVEETSR